MRRRFVDRAHDPRSISPARCVHVRATDPHSTCRSALCIFLESPPERCSTVCRYFKQSIEANSTATHSSQHGAKG